MLRITRALLRHASLTFRDFSRGFEAYVRHLSDNPAFAHYVKRYVAQLSVPALFPGAPPQKFDALDDLYVEDEDALAAARADEPVDSTLFVRDACITVITEVAAVPDHRAATGFRLTALLPRGGPYRRVVDRDLDSRLAVVSAVLRAPRNADLVVSRQIAFY